MFSRANYLFSWRRLLPVVILFFGLGVSVTGVMAGNPPADAPVSGQIASQLTNDTSKAPPADNSKTLPGAPQTADAFVFLQPNTDTAGSCPAPANGGTTQVGCRFVLDLILNNGSNTDVTAHQSYLTFSYQLIQNARVLNIGSSCVPTSTVTADLGDDLGFDAVVQNEVCDGPNPCTFRGVTVDPGSLAYASCALSNTPQGGVFRVARIGLCATNPGTATLHWQFSPPAPSTRDSEIVNSNGDFIHNPALYTDYVINIAAPVVMLTGHVTWQGRPAQPNALQQLPITLTLKSATTEMDYPSVNTDARGSFAVNVGNLPSGNYTWRVKGPKYLANAGNLNLSGAPTTSTEMGLMRVGDANNDNVVNVVDFNILRGTFGKGLGDPGYDDRADFNGDHVVNVLDVNLHKSNMGQSGAGPITPWR